MIIGLTGPNASGKGVVGEYLREKGFECFSLSDIIREEATKRGLDHSRINLIDVGNDLRTKYGPAVLAKRISEKVNGSNVVVDSIRNPHEVEQLKKSKEFILIGIEAPPEVRFRREVERGRVGAPKSLQEFIIQEEIENSKDELSQQLRKCMNMTDVVIVNNSTMDVLKRKIDQIIWKRPSWDEYFLKMSLLVAERSTCLRHHVGCVLVKEKRVLTTGYNGAPSGTKDCLKLGCLRDEKKIPSGERHEICRATHAEQNALIQACIHGISVEGGTMYCTHSPCILCAKMIVNARIKKFVTCGKYADQSFKELFDQVEIEFVVLPKPDTMINVLD